MNVIVAFSCSGKTTFSKEQIKYIDFDFIVKKQEE